MAPGMSMWVDRCNRASLPQCGNFDSSCPDYGIVPCQYSAVTLVDSQGLTTTVVDYGTIRNGDSRCLMYEDIDVCDYGIDKCNKVVMAQYTGGNIDRWIITKTCGGCAVSYQVTQECDLSQCLGVSGVCSPNCYFKSTQSLLVTRCYECGGDRCNRAASVRAAHQLLMLGFGGLALVLLVRKCRA
eukprot:CAMPEP_0113694060 /NCGR_PEP_ID=MMETSP0038_2-20120614/20049_1 /TAXON_ID=2898 /ORGANISM="Cryptomonas paramecium" /LENGTH=184 /DNA_ID=CAMNT_0000616279 /DNA_START=149 /DNA_END=703 /DNA_ORIENTATION=- /assembly_acc=CAM_ASM_000170